MRAKVLEISLFGSCIVRSVEPGAFEITGKKPRALFALLATAPHGCRSRTFLQETLWGASCYDTGRQSLRRALSDIKSAMGPYYAQLITTNNSEVTLDLGKVTFSGRPGQGTFLEGLDIPTQDFVNWREMIRSNPDQISSLFRSPSASVPRPPVPSVTVVPLLSVESNPELSILGDWFAEEICRSLSRSNLLAVISHLSSRALAGRQIDIEAVRSKLSVDYCVCGSIRQAGDEVITDIDFLDAETGRILWTRQFCGNLSDFISGAGEGLTNIVTSVGNTIASDTLHYIRGRPINEIVSERRKLGRPTVMILPSGNTFQDRLHGEINADQFKDDAFSFTWVVQPNDRTSSYLELWFPQDVDPKTFSLELKAPFGKAAAALPLVPDPDCKGGDPRKFEILKLVGQAGEEPIGQMSIDHHRLSGRWRAMIALAPTEPNEINLPAAPCGDWTVTLRREAGAPSTHDPIYIWIQRDADPDEFRSGSRQSFLKDQRYRRYDADGKESQDDTSSSHIRRFGTLNSLATGKSSLIVSGCRPAAGTDWSRPRPVPSGYSSAGKPGAGELVGQVDCTAPSDRSHVVPGILAAGTRSGSYGLVQGTSVAAPLVARRLSEAFARCTDEQVRQAEADNYLSIIEKMELQDQSEEDIARLGKFLVL